MAIGVQYNLRGLKKDTTYFCKYKIIAFCGLAGSGKDTAAAALKPLGYTLLKFADPLKDLVCNVYGFTREQLEDQEFKSTPHPNLGGQTPRHALQWLGTEGFRSVYENTWVDYTLREIQKYPYVVISDCRFPNEALAIQQAGGIVAYINRPGLVAGNHASEQEIMKVEAMANLKFYNRGSKEDLQRAVLSKCLAEVAPHG